MPSLHPKPTVFAKPTKRHLAHEGCARSMAGRSFMRLAFALTVCSGAGAAAQAEPGFVGRFSGQGEGRVSVTVTPVQGRAAGTSYQVSADTAIRNVCTGAIAGLAHPSGPGRLRLRIGNEQSGICTLDLTYSADRRRVAVEETGCGEFHGMSCGFSGRLTRR